MQLENLIQQFQQKDKAAFATLYQMYADNICGVIKVELIMGDSLGGFPKEAITVLFKMTF